MAESIAATRFEQQAWYTESHLQQQNRLMSIEYKTRTQVVAEAIRQKILTGQIKGGEPLRQAALAEELKVSRIPVREALLQLEAEGLVEFEAHKGATATRLSAEQITELFELRAMLETELLRRAIPLLTEDDLQKAEQLRSEMAAAYQQQDSSGSWSVLNTQYHLTLYRAANRPLTYDLVQNLMTNADRYIRVHLMLAGGVQKADPEHSELLKLCRERNVTAACDLLSRHILGAADEVKSIVSSLNTPD